MDKSYGCVPELDAVFAEGLAAWYILAMQFPGRDLTAASISARAFSMYRRRLAAC